METPSRPDDPAASSSKSAEDVQQQIHAPDDLPKEDMEGLSPEERVAYKLNKARHLRRLRERWRCKTTGHVYCFTDGEAPHVELNDEDMHTWAGLIHDGYATLLIVPERISGKHTISADSMTLNTVTFQRAFHFKTNPSLSDLRSLRNRLASERSSLESSASSSSLSFMPGIGSMSGKGILWVGEKILRTIMKVEPRRQIWIIKRAVKQIEKLPSDSRRQWMLKNKSAMLRHADHLLELSSDDYSEGQRASSFDLANSFSRSLWGHLSTGNDGDGLSLFHLMSAKLYPLTSLHDDSGNISPLGVSLREVQLEEDMDIDADDINYMFGSFVNCACGQLFQGSTSKLRRDALEYLDRLNDIPEGHRELDRLSKAGGFLEHMAECMFINGIEDHDEHATAVLFFTGFAQDHPAFRRYLLEPNGIPLLVEHFKIAPAGMNGCPAYAGCSAWALHIASGCKWAVQTVRKLDLCPYLVKSLLSHRFPSSGRSHWDHYYLLGILSNLAVLGDEDERSLVRAVVTPEVCDRLQHIKEEEWEYSWVAEKARLFVGQLFEAIKMKSK